MRILIADDDKTSRQILGKALKKWGYEVEEAVNGTQAIEILKKPDSPQIVILDWIMPELNGLETLKEIKKIERENHFYIIMLTFKAKKYDIITGLNSGANDYLIKPFDIEEFQARVNVGRRVIEMQQELIESRKKLEYQIAHDLLTGMYSRGFIMERLREEIARAERVEDKFVVAMCDIDHFKSINDRYGHQSGDKALCEFSKIIAENIRGYDRAGRIGGEEFLIIAPIKTAGEEKNVFERIRKKVEEHKIKLESGEISMTVSIGVVLYEKGATPDSMIAKADKLLYEAKKKGRNRVEFCE